MNLKAIIQKIASWFKAESAVVEQGTIKAASGAWELTEKELAIHVEHIIKKDKQMSTSEAATPATTGNNVNTAVQLALALKAIDPSLSVEAVQAATSAALTAAYPVAAAA